MSESHGSGLPESLTRALYLCCTWHAGVRSSVPDSLSIVTGVEQEGGLHLPQLHSSHRSTLARGSQLTNFQQVSSLIGIVYAGKSTPAAAGYTVRTRLSLCSTCIHGPIRRQTKDHRLESRSSDSQLSSLAIRTAVVHTFSLTFDIWRYWNS